MLPLIAKEVLLEVLVNIGMNLWGIYDNFHMKNKVDHSLTFLLSLCISNFVKQSALAITGTMLTLVCNILMKVMSIGFKLWKRTKHNAGNNISTNEIKLF